MTAADVNETFIVETSTRRLPLGIVPANKVAVGQPRRWCTSIESARAFVTQFRLSPYEFAAAMRQEPMRSGFPAGWVAVVIADSEWA